MALLLVAAVLAVPGGADAARFAAASAEPVAGPVLAGSQVMYVVVNGAGRGELRAGRRRVADVGPDRNATGYKLNHYTGWSLSASPTWVAVVRSEDAEGSGEPTFDSTQIFVGPPGGPLSRFASCTSDSPGYGSYWEARVDGDRIAARMTDCPGYVDARLVVRDLAGGSDIATIQGPHVVLGGGITAVRLAGDYLAWLEDYRDVVVYDLTTASELYRVHDIYDRAFELQADGKVVTYIRNAASLGAPGRCSAQLVWYGPDDPLPHQISACPLYGMSISGGRVLYLDHLASDYSLATDSGRGELKVATLDQSQPPKTLFSGPAGLLGGFSFDGSRATYAIRGCTAARGTIYVDDLSGPDAAPETVRPCELSFASKRATADRHRVVTIPLACPSGCRGTLWLRQGRRQASSTAALATPRVRVRLRRSAWTQLLKRRALKLRAIAVVTQPDLKQTVVRATLMIRAPAQ